ncbi:hypothetical protein HNV08_14055 [Winogradskyella eckloniae]|uniref:hypothetical protein n=1 Tax=Winogradskyella eckloniae TaxID=1089306 RepID=UPI00156336DB|nr:hypothetical protein [Winogradskyella eckloniae]NRD21178.1 hypothetical protein [Winogradskyella eckloniae]
MKYFIAIIILVCCLIASQLWDTYYSTYLCISIVVLIYFILFSWELSIFKNNFKNEYKFRSQKKSLDVFDLIFAILISALYLAQDNISEFEILFIMCLWSKSIVSCVMWFIYKVKKPYKIFINEDKLYLNQQWFKMRLLPNLIQINYNRITKTLNLEFKIKSDISINIKDYKPEDIEKLLELCLEKSEHNVFIPNNLNLSEK